MRWLGRSRRGPGIAVELLLFVAAGATFATATVCYRVVSGHSERPPWWVLALAAIVVAWLLPALRPRADDWVARLAFGPAAVGHRIMVDFMGRLATAVDIDDVLPRLAETAAKSVHSSRGEVAVQLTDGRQWRRTWTALTDSAGGAARDVSVAVRHHGDIVGEIAVDAERAALTDIDRAVLADLAAPAGVALATVRLTVELRQRVAALGVLAEELASSQARLVAARREARTRVLRRVEAHVTTRLTEVDGSLQELRRAVGSDEATSLAATTRAQVKTALDALREVARGIFPPLLADAGLQVALRAWGETRTPPVHIEAGGDLSVLRADPAAEAALYFACVTAFDGSAVDSQATHVDLVVDPDSIRLSIPLADQQPPSFELTVRPIADRLGALGGTLGRERRDGRAFLVARLPAATGLPSPPPGLARPPRR